MTIGCAIILTVGIILMGGLIGVGICIGGALTNPLITTIVLEDEEIDIIEDRACHLVKRYAKETIGSMFND